MSRGQPGTKRCLASFEDESIPPSPRTPPAIGAPPYDHAPTWDIAADSRRWGNMPTSLLAAYTAESSTVNSSLSQSPESAPEGKGSPGPKGRKRKGSQHPQTPWPLGETHAWTVAQITTKPHDEVYEILGKRFNYRAYAISTDPPLWYGRDVHTAPCLTENLEDAKALKDFFFESIERPLEGHWEAAIYDQVIFEARKFKCRLDARSSSEKRIQEKRDLKAVNARLDEEHARLNEEHARLSAKNTTLKDEVRQLQTSAHQLNSENQRLRMLLSQRGLDCVLSPSASPHFDDQRLPQLQRSRAPAPLGAFAAGAGQGQILEDPSVDAHELDDSPDLLELSWPEQLEIEGDVEISQNPFMGL